MQTALLILDEFTPIKMALDWNDEDDYQVQTRHKKTNILPQKLHCWKTYSLSYISLMRLFHLYPLVLTKSRYWII